MGVAVWVITRYAPGYKNMFKVCRFVIYVQCLPRSRQVLKEFDQAVNRTFYGQKLKQTVVSIHGRPQA